MEIVGFFIESVAMVINSLLSLYFWIVLIAVLISWINPDPYNPLVRILRNLTEPVFYRVRRWMPFTMIGGLDLSPIVVMIAIQFLQSFVVRALMFIAASVGGKPGMMVM